MGRIAAPYGVRGWVKVQPFTATSAGLAGYGEWWLERDGGWEARRVEQVRVHGGWVVGKLAGCEDRDAAGALRGSRIAVPRAALPPAAENEFYWADLIGLRVVNGQGQDFGAIRGLIRTGANDVMVVHGEGDAARERLIPFIAPVVRQVDIAAGRVSVDWGADY
jgi:16S rRNA processing protein RimM